MNVSMALIFVNTTVTTPMVVMCVIVNLVIS